jgi:hypothetical protein
MFLSGDTTVARRSLRLDLLQKSLQRGGDMLTGTIAGAKEGKPTPKPAPTEETEVVEEEGRKG